MPHNQSAPDDPFDPRSVPEISTTPPGLEPTETEKQQDTLFNASLKAGLISNAGLLAPRRPEIFDPPEDIPWSDSFGAVFEAIGFANSVFGGTLTKDFANEPLQDISLDDLERLRPDAWEFLKEGLEDPESPRGRPRNVILRNFRNFADMDQQMLILEEAEARLEIMNANGLSAMIAGSVAAVGVDIALMAGLGAIVPGSAFLTGARIAAKTPKMVRLLAATRFSLLAAGEGVLERGMHARIDPTVTLEDIIMAGTIGLTVGSAIGAAFPKLARVSLRSQQRADDWLDDASRQLIDPGPNNDNIIDSARAASGKDAGAATVPTDVRTPALLTGGFGVGRALPKGVQKWATRNPKRVAATIAGRWRALSRADPRIQGGKEFWDVIARTWRISTVFEEEVGGAVARRVSADTEFSLLEAKRIVRVQDVRTRYKDLVKDLGVTGASGSVRRLAINLEIDTLTTRFGRDLVTETEFEEISDLIAHAKNNMVTAEDPSAIIASMGIEESAGVSVIPPHIRERFGNEKIKTILKHAEANSAKDDEFYEAFFEIEKRLGFVDESARQKHYRPQRWNRDMIENNKGMMVTLLARAYHATPDDDWLHAATIEVTEIGPVSPGTKRAPPGTVKVTVEPLMKEGETWSDIMKSDPERGQDILELWHVTIRKEMQKIKDSAVAEADRVLREHLGTTADVEIARLRKNVSASQKSLARMNTEFNKVKRSKKKGAAERLNELNNKISRAELKGARNAERLAEIDQALGDVEELTKVLGRGRSRGKAAAKRITKRLTKTVGRKTKASLKLAKAPNILQQINDTIDDILRSKNPYGILDDMDKIKTSARFKRRGIHLGDERFSPEARQLLLHNSHDTRAGYVSSVGRQIALREAFPELFAEAGKGITDTKLIVDKALAGFRRDLQLKDLDPSIRRKTEIDLKTGTDILDRLLSEFTNGDLALQQQLGSGLAEFAVLAKLATAASALGTYVVSQLGDVGTLIMAGGQMGTGMRFAWRGGPGSKKTFLAMTKEEPDIAATMQGLAVMDMSMFKARGDIDDLALNIPGSWMRKSIRISGSTMHAVGIAQWAHAMNRMIRGGFGLDFARQLQQHIGKFDELPDYLRTFYASHGIGKVEAAEMHQLLLKFNRKFVDGKLLIPNSADWIKVGRADLLKKYKAILQVAGDDALLVPGLGDRPFLRANPIGSLLIQFQSFMFTAGERFIAPMIQTWGIHPNDMRTYAAVLASVHLGVLVDMLKTSLRGKEELEGWFANWDTEKGQADNLWAGLLRSPLLAGNSSLMLEILLTSVGGAINDATGTSILGTRGARMQNQGIISKFSGPAVGRGDRVAGVVSNFLNGNVEEAVNQMQSLTPPFNLLPLKVLSLAYEEFT